ncbi:MAG: ketoacyl-ACP synthase III [Nanoarchaeota archaeon]|nr:ketoacyl-ACP synthase III [Nanoarchaeota archaeon]MBU1320931.1 ketoacyl-ACP synthase III [Nanoarchaeota archaeon]MBU1597544.1 ketoacyl-ACP synthase III [Nanoarchaeota archaeon]MBU2441953.1 ketoacyl-ACP synthase III [Nanoarchaeota archaeon]
MSNIFSVFSGTGSYIPKVVVKNEDFLKHTFYDSDGERIKHSKDEYTADEGWKKKGEPKSTKQVIDKFEETTRGKERRYVTDDLVTSDIGFFAAKDALISSGIDKESLDYIIFAHNFGDVRADNKRSDFVPTLAARVKHMLEIHNPKTIAYDLPFGCPGWLQGVIQADYYIKSGDAKRIMVVGAETLSRVYDPFDMDCMLYADGAGATILEAMISDFPVGILAHAARSDTIEHAHMLWMDKSYNPDYKGDEIFLKMYGNKLYKYALRTVPLVVKESLDKAGLTLDEVDKVLIHQANAKMDDAILERLFHLYGKKADEIPERMMPLTIPWLGNSSVATIPTLLDMIMKKELTKYSLKTGDIVVFASVGAGMNINSVVYRMP